MIAAILGAGAAVGVDAAVSRLTDAGGAILPQPTSPAEVPYLVGRQVRGVPAGLVRADVRAFKVGTGSDYSEAFAAALQNAEVVYVPPGVWETTRVIEVPGQKILWSDGGYDREDRPVVGAIVRSVAPMPATVRLAGQGAGAVGINVDGGGMAEAAVEFASDSVNLTHATARNGTLFALKATSNFCTVIGGLFQQPSNVGNAMFQSGSDLIMWGARIKKGDIPLVVAGSGAIIGGIHVTGKTEDAAPSSAVVKVVGLRNQFVNVFYDTAIGPSVLLEQGANGNRFIGMTIRNGGTDGSFPVIRIEAQAEKATNNRFDGFHTDSGRGSGWSYLLEMLGPLENVEGNQLGSGSADAVDRLWNVRPSSVGDISRLGKLSRSGGSASLSAGARQLTIQHGLIDVPASISITPSRGAGGAPDVDAGPDALTLSWASPPGQLTVYWTAAL